MFAIDFSFEDSELLSFPSSSLHPVREEEDNWVEENEEEEEEEEEDDEEEE